MQNKILVVSVPLFLTISLAFAQYEAVVFDYQHAYFNNGQPLKAESYLLFSGAIRSQVERVEISIFRARSKHEKPLYHNTWKRMYGNAEGTFSMTCNYKLRGNAEYDLVFDYFRPISDAEKDKLRTSLQEALDSYLQEAFTSSGRKVKLLISKKLVINDLNRIVEEGLADYRNDSETTFKGFSDILKRALKNLSGRRLRDSEAAHLNDDNSNRKENKMEGRAKLYENRLGDVKKLAYKELEQVLGTHLLIKEDTRSVSDYPTTSTIHVLSVNAGYGAVYLEGDTQDLTYATSPYIGLSFPLGNSAFSSRFWTNSAISLGTFTNNFKDANGNEISGPIFGRPYYLGYGYRLFRFVRFNAGAVFLEDKLPSSTSFLNSVQIKPFVGISAEINLWLGLGDKKR
ncbi:hypothetical protein [Thermoflexibacter ruber]|uniref:Uncharacterized protein n=1 Tax=Thermoflexibacter ruber TaxID=1003 RepID=A0A1I2F676_9BACT|nr:hypothetical protein [Thermoflexibacter ruber]SFF00208.1 hypothetical protein SAMN04488541_101284 [Thermoflexibacter ruber]